jgi:hypothetical protein
MTLYDETVTLADQLSLSEKIRLIEHLSAAMLNDLEVQAFRQMPWQEFVDKTAGILADDPIERPQQLSLEEREPLE